MCPIFAISRRLVRFIVPKTARKEDSASTTISQQPNSDLAINIGSASLYCIYSRGSWAVEGVFGYISPKPERIWINLEYKRGVAVRSHTKIG